MSTKLFKYNIAFLLTSMFLGVGMTSCIYDDIDSSSESSAPDYLDPDGFSLGFSIELDKMPGSTRGTVDGDGNYDDYIDTQNKFRVFFFDENGQFIFEAIDRTVRPFVDENDGGKKKWFVHIPVNYIVDSKGNNFDVDLLKDQLKEHNFKVAVLANWPHASEGIGCEGTKIADWGWNESIINPQATNIKNINDFHHAAYDSYYSNFNASSSRPSRGEVYDFVMDGDNIGVKTNWVRNRNSTAYDGPWGEYEVVSDDMAEGWIRANCDPTPQTNRDEKVYRNFTFLQYYWNFDGAYKAIKLGEPAANQEKWGTFPQGWLERNGTSIGQWMNEVVPKNDGTNGVNASAAMGTKTWTGDDAEMKFTGNNGKVNRYNGYYGVVMATGQSAANFNFKLISSGKLIIKASSNGQNNTSVLTVKYNGNSTKTYNLSGSTPVELDPISISVTENTQECDIWSSTGTSVIYSIEYIRGSYFKDADREVVLPSEEKPIPMYGVQNYKALTDWEEGSTFDLSNKRLDYFGDNYQEGDFKNVHLIRSLAKVEVYLPEKDGKAPKYVYMRSGNRYSRCEPMDVETPTNEIWDSSIEDDFNNSNHSSCELWTVQSYGPNVVWQGSELSGTTELSSYTNFMSWYYGSWASANWDGKGNGWNFTAHNIKGRESGGVTVPAGTYPRIFNSDIERSDYAAMAYCGVVNGLHKYVMYMPEKNIDDPNYPGFHSSTPKVPHIEYRYENKMGSAGKEWDVNNSGLDNNECYRVYFMDYAADGGQIYDIVKDKFNEYERDNTKLQKHWPIMRNHVYRFYVNGTRSGAQTISSEVRGWNGKKLHK